MLLTASDDDNDDFQGLGPNQTVDTGEEDNGNSGDENGDEDDKDLVAQYECLQAEIQLEHKVSHIPSFVYVISLEIM